MSHHRLPRWLPVAMAGVLAVGLAACGSDDSGDDETTTVASTAPATSDAASTTGAPADSSAAPDTTADGATTTAAEPTGDPYKLGVVIEESGTLSALGKPELQAIELAVEHANAKGGVNGRPVEIVVRDSASDPATASAMARELVDSGDIEAIVGPATGASCNAVNAIVVPEGVMHYCLSPIATELNPLTYWALAPLSTYPEFTIPWFESEGITSIGLIRTADATGDAMERIVEHVVEESGGTVTSVGVETFNSGATDVQTQMTKLRDAKPDVVFAGVSGANMLPIVQGMNLLGMEQPLFATQGAVVHTVLDLVKDSLPAGDLVGPLVWVDVPLDEVPADLPYRAQIEEFVTAWDEKHDTATGHLEGGAYDAVGQIVDALRSGAESGEDIAAHIESAEYTGVLGPYEYSADNHQGAEVVIAVLEFGADGAFHTRFVGK